MIDEKNVIEALVRDEKFDAALAALAKVEKTRRLGVAELVLKGECVQLASGAVTPPLGEAERSFSAALEQDEDYVPALLELGWFHYAVQDEAEEGLAFFERALEISLDQLRDAIKGKRRCLEELESREAADEFLRDIVRSALKEEDFPRDLE